MKLDYDKILSLMMKKQMTKSELLEAAGISDFTLRKIAKGANCRYSTAECIAGALGVDPEKLELKEAPEEASEENVPEEERQPDALPLPDALTEALNTIKQYGESEYQRGKLDMGVIFLKAVKEAIDRWNEANEADEEENE